MEDSRPNPALDPPEEPVDPTGRSILALMDSDGLWESVQSSIRAVGAHAERAPNASAAMQAIRTAASSGRGYTAVLVHLEMAGLDAARFARALRRNEEFDATPLILATTLGRSGDSALAMEWGYSAYLSEPVTIELMRQTLDASIRQRCAAEGTGSLVTLVTRHSIAEESKGRRCILIVDDNVLDQLLVISALKKMGYASEVLTNPDEILSRVEAKTGHLVVVTLGDDRPDPTELVRRIRASGDSVRKVPILAVVPSDQASPARQAAFLDIDATVTSSTALGDLCHAIEGLLLRVPSRTRSEEPLPPFHLTE